MLMLKSGVSPRYIILALGYVICLIVDPGNSYAQNIMDDTNFQHYLIRKAVAAEASNLKKSGHYYYHKQLYKRAARLFANAYIFDDQVETLLMVAQCSLRAGWNFEALAIYLNIVHGPLAQMLSASNKKSVEDGLKQIHSEAKDADNVEEEMLHERTEIASKSFHLQEFPNAREELSLAYIIRPLPRFLFNIGQAYRREDRLEEAYILYNRFVATEQNTRLSLEARSYLRELRPVTFTIGGEIFKRPGFWLILTVTSSVLSGWIAALVMAQKR